MEAVKKQTKLIKIRHVIERVCLSRAQIYKMMAEGRFPRQVMLTERSVAWREHDIDSWIADRSSSSQRTALGLDKEISAAFHAMRANRA
jgi:prophage regulatory protein